MSGGGEKGTGTTKTPADFLKSIRGRPVVVKLNSGVDYRGLFLYFFFHVYRFFFSRLFTSVLFYSYLGSTYYRQSLQGYFI